MYGSGRELVMLFEIVISSEPYVWQRVEMDVCVSSSSVSSSSKPSLARPAHPPSPLEPASVTHSSPPLPSLVGRDDLYASRRGPCRPPPDGAVCPRERAARSPPTGLGRPPSSPATDPDHRRLRASVLSLAWSHLRLDDRGKSRESRRSRGGKILSSPCAPFRSAR